MRISIERAALLGAAGHAQSVVERRNTIPILANVLIEAQGDEVAFRATDLDVEVIDRAPARVDRPGATTVSALTLHEIVRKLPDGASVELSEEPGSGRLAVSAGRAHFQLATLPKEDFPRAGEPRIRGHLRHPRARPAGGCSTSRASPSRRRRRATTSTASISTSRTRAACARCARWRPTATASRASTPSCRWALRTCRA